jgi:non-lysosomal glucosylceramidase
MEKSMSWPVLRTYDRDHLDKIALPLGGIGTGTVSLGGRGDLRDWEVVNRPAKGFNPSGQGISPLLAVYVKGATVPAQARLLEGPVSLSEYEGPLGSTARNHGFPRFRNCTFQTAYPFGQVQLSDPDMPVRAVLKAFNPLIPGDADGSAYPAAILRVVLENASGEDLDTSVCLSVPNFIGEDGANVEKGVDLELRPAGAKGNKNVVKEGGGLTGILMTAPELAADAEQKGTLCIATPSGQEITHRTAWADLSWGDTVLNFWDDFTADGRLEEQTSKTDKPVASLCISQRLPAGASKEITLVLTWHFPNRKTWSRVAEGESGIIGNHYTTRFADAADAAEQVFASLATLERKTIEFVSAVCASNLPVAVLEAALFNVSTLRTQTCFRTPDGHFFGWEGCFDKQGCCAGSCNHVWNYEHTTAFLFGDLARTMRDVEFVHATGENGHMVFRADLPLGRRADEKMACCRNVSAADGQMGCLMKLYRDWQLSGDDNFLRAMYPAAKKALEFCWIPGGWDADRDGLMEGCQHNTMDVEYYGPNPQMGFWYLGALRCMQEMAAHLKDDAFAATCGELCASGARRLDERLFNGEYYEHIIEAPGTADKIAAGLKYNLGSDNLDDPDLQLGSGCLVDQLVGQYMAHVMGLGHLSDPAKHRKTLQSLYRYNFKKGFHNHFNHFRSFVLGDEAGVLMATYPKGRRPKRPFPYFNEVMTGFEYALAVHLLYEGMAKEGLEIIEAIRDRYDGKRRSPFDEAECGHHYARAMAAWAAVLALTGFQYSGVTQTMAFKAGAGTYFWSNGFAWGTCTIDGDRVRLEVKHGTLALKRFELTGVGAKVWDAPKTIAEGEGVDLTCPA